DALPISGVELQAPFGGMKNSSSHSREPGQAAIEFFTAIKTVFVKAYACESVAASRLAGQGNPAKLNANRRCSMDREFAEMIGEENEEWYEIQTSHPGPQGSLPLTDQLLRHAPSGDLFGWSQNVGMGWQPSRLNGKQFLLLSTLGGIRNDDGTPIALGYHTGHWEVGLLMKAAANEIAAQGGVPFAGYVSDPC